MRAMKDDSYRVIVAKDLEDLIPVFMSNRRKELDTLRVALAAADFDPLPQLGHRMKGVCNSYGFLRVSEIGKYVEDFARIGDPASLESTIAQYSAYLLKIEISN